MSDRVTFKDIAIGQREAMNAFFQSVTEMDANGAYRWLQVMDRLLEVKLLNKEAFERYLDGDEPTAPKMEE